MPQPDDGFINCFETGQDLSDILQFGVMQDVDQAEGRRRRVAEGDTGTGEIEEHVDRRQHAADLRENRGRFFLAAGVEMSGLHRLRGWRFGGWLAITSCSIDCRTSFGELRIWSVVSVIPIVAALPRLHSS